jgi:hypothetical protein
MNIENFDVVYQVLLSVMDFNRGRLPELRQLSQLDRDIGNLYSEYHPKKYHVDRKQYIFYE